MAQLDQLRIIVTVRLCCHEITAVLSIVQLLHTFEFKVK